MLFIGIFIFLLVWQWNGLIYSIGTGFDAGVQQMETLVASMDSLYYGKDLLATPYPPLSWLYKGVLPALTSSYTNALLQICIINFLSVFLRVCIIAYFWKDVQSPSAKVIAALASVFIFLAHGGSWGTTRLDLCILLSSILICKLYLRLSGTFQFDNKIIHKITVFVGILISIPQLAKFSYVSMSLAFIVIVCIILIVYKKYSDIGLFIGTYVASTSILWVSSGERLQYLPSYIYGTFNFVKGYSEVMASQLSGYPDGFRDLVFALCMCCAYGLMLLFLLVYDRKRMVCWFVAAPFLFMIFKEGFVRSDIAHTPYFITSFLYIVCYLLFVLKETEQISELPHFNVLKYARNFLCVFFSLVLGQSLISNYWYPVSTMYSDIETLGSKEAYIERIEDDKKNLRELPEYEQLYQSIKPYEDKTLGMLSNEQSFFIAYDLMERFKINPIISIWENFSPHSEMLAAEQYYGENAPDVLLYRPETLDGGYFLFPMGNVFQALLENYSVDKIDQSSHLILLRNEQVRREAYPLGNVQKFSIGDFIEIPKKENSYVFMKIDWDLNLFGKLAALILKPGQAHIEFTLENGNTQEYRFFRQLSQNGIYISTWIDGHASELAAVMEGDISNSPIRSVKLTGNKFFYKNNFDVSFYTVPFTEAQASYQQNSEILTVEGNSELLSGNYQTFYAQDYAFTEAGSRWSNVGDGQKEIYIRIPKEGWNTLRFDFPPQEGEYDLKSLTCKGKRAVIDASNGVEFVETGNEWHIVTGKEDPFIILHLEK